MPPWPPFFSPTGVGAGGRGTYSDARRARVLLCAPPMWGRSAPPPRVTFFSKRKSPKIRQGGTPGPPWGALSSPQQRKRCSPQKGAPLRATRKPHNHLPRHGLTAGSVTPGIARGETKTALPTRSKWQIGLGEWQKPYRGGAGTAGGAKRPPQGGPRGVAPGAPLVPFVVKRKEPRVWAG